MTDIHIPDDVSALDDETLIDQHGTLNALEERFGLTGDQEQYLWDLREELLKRASVGGPHADYEGGSDAA